VFGSARVKEDNRFSKDAYKLGKLLFKNGYCVRTGAGPGIMEATAKGFIEERKGS